jgi:homoserine acetyltransferase
LYLVAIADNEWLLGDVLSPEKYYIVIPALFGNGESSSPSNTPSLRPWPRVSFYDNVRAQNTLLTQHLGVTHARAVLGWSMGAAQTFQWATQYPDFMDIAVPFCGSAKTSLHNQVFLEGVKSALLAGRGDSSAGINKDGKRGAMEVSPTSGGVGRTWSQTEKEVGLRALGRVYAGWGFSQAFYRQELFKTLGFPTLEKFMTDFWETWALSKDPENMLAMLYTWQSGDVSLQEPYNGSFRAAMQGIKARTLVMPGKTDLYFPPEDSEIEVANMIAGVGELAVFDSVWGHWAGGPGDSKEDVAFLNRKLKEFGL